MVSKLILLIIATLFIGSLFFPMWQIELEAPQYPEGLVLKLHANKIGGDVEIINGLNHYIGMATLHTENFFEFTSQQIIIVAATKVVRLFHSRTCLVGLAYVSIVSNFIKQTVRFVIQGILS